MRTVFAFLAGICAFLPEPGRALQVGYSLTVTTAYADGDVFANRIDGNFREPSDGFFQVTNTGGTTFTGVIGTIAVSSFAGDLSWRSATLALSPGNAISVAMPDDSKAVGGFNGPYYFYRPGVEITLTGTVSDATGSEPVDLLVADRDIHSGVPRTDPFGLLSDSFVLQGGDPWGFNTGDVFALGQAMGTYTFSQAVAEPGSLPVLALTGLTLAAIWLQKRRRTCV